MNGRPPFLLLSNLTTPPPTSTAAAAEAKEAMAEAQREYGATFEAAEGGGAAEGEGVAAQ